MSAPESGGATPGARLGLVNLAARISDGEQIVVPRRGAVWTGTAAATASRPGPST